MAYTTNPHLPKVRRQAVLLLQQGLSTRQVARYLGYSQSVVVKWRAKANRYGFNEIPTLSSRPKHNPKALTREVVIDIIQERVKRRRCSEHVYYALKKKGVEVSLSSVKRTLDRCGLLRKRSPWKRPHDFTLRPKALYTGALLQCDTIHLMTPDGPRIYAYTLIDLYSRWAYAEVVERIGAQSSVEFIKRAQGMASFKFKMIQSDNGSEFSTWFTNSLLSLDIRHRHGRVGKSNDQAHVERFNRTVQEECLDYVPNNLVSLQEALIKYLSYYNNERTHMGINYLVPVQLIPSS
jgi:transposase InsO family protein